MTAGPWFSLGKIRLIIHYGRTHPPRRSEAKPHWMFVLFGISDGRRYS